MGLRSFVSVGKTLRDKGGALRICRLHGLVTVAGLPLIFMVVFCFSERSLHRWLGGKPDRDIDMIARIASGEYKWTPQGAYLMSLNDAFPPEVRGAPFYRSKVPASKRCFMSAYLGNTNSARTGSSIVRSFLGAIVTNKNYTNYAKALKDKDFMPFADTQNGPTK